MPPPFEAILFDFDGVLLDSEPVHFACWSEALSPFGLRLDWETYAREYIGIADREMVERAAQRSDPPLNADLLWAQYPIKRRCFRRRMAEHPPFAPGLAEFIGSLNSEYRLAVVSSSARDEVETALECGGILPYLGAVVCGEDVTHPKPAPEPYLLAARRLGVRTALVVEDSPSGIMSGRAAGFEVLKIDRPSNTETLLRRRLGLPNFQRA